MFYISGKQCQRLFSTLEAFLEISYLNYETTFLFTYECVCTVYIYSKIGYFLVWFKEEIRQKAQHCPSCIKNMVS